MEKDMERKGSSQMRNEPEAEGNGKMRSKTEKKACGKTRNETGNETSSKTRNETGKEGSNKMRNETGNEIGSRTDNKTAEEAGSKTWNRIAGTTGQPPLTSEEIGQYAGGTVRIRGSIYKIRKMSDFAFVLLRTPREVLQCVYEPVYAAFDLEMLKEESCVILTAEVIPEERSKTGYDLRLKEAEILSVPYEESPIVINQKLVGTSLENLLNYRPVTLRNNSQRAIFKFQEGVVNAFRTFLIAERFTEIHTPKIVQAGAEGGANIFKLDYFGRQAYLAQSPQFYKQMMVGVFERVFEIGPVFRAEKHDTKRHLNEYTGVDFEMGYIESDTDIMEMETKMLRYTVEYLKEHCEKECSLLQVKLPVIVDIPAIPFEEAKTLIADTYKRHAHEAKDFEPEEERLLCELVQKETGSEFVFVTHYPGEKRPFYAMDNRQNPNVTDSFDLLFRGLEITTGGQRIHDYREQIAKMKRFGLDPAQFESYLMLHKYGVPPHGGLGIGLERFTSRLLMLDNVRYASLFPRDINRVTP